VTAQSRQSGAGGPSGVAADPDGTASAVWERSAVPENIGTSPPSPSITRPGCCHSSIVRIGNNAPLLHSLDRLQRRFTHGCEGGEAI
jgi:hypothetical protein